MKKCAKQLASKKDPKKGPPELSKIDYFGPGTAFSSLNRPKKGGLERPKPQKREKSRNSPNNRKTCEKKDPDGKAGQPGRPTRQKTDTHDLAGSGRIWKDLEGSGRI